MAISRRKKALGLVGTIMIVMLLGVNYEYQTLIPHQRKHSPVELATFPPGAELGGLGEPAEPREQTDPSEAATLGLLSTGLQWPPDDLAFCERLRTVLSSKFVDLGQILGDGNTCFVVQSGQGVGLVSLSKYALYGHAVEPLTGPFLTRAQIVEIWLLEVFRAGKQEDAEGTTVLLSNMHDWGNVPAEMYQELGHLRVPYLLMCGSNSDTNSMLIPDIYFIGQRGYLDLKKTVKTAGENSSWDLKQNSSVFRGVTTGGSPGERTWLDVPRARVAYLSNSPPLKGIMDAGISQVVQIAADSDHNVVIQSMTESGVMKNVMSMEEQIRNYKVLIDIDGNSNSWEGTFWKLLSNSVTVKIECSYHQWYYYQLKSWEHYVPVRCDLSDLARNTLWALAPENKEKVTEMVKSSTDLIDAITYEGSIDEFVQKFREYVIVPSEHPLAKLS
mmetsp:Transcript_3255/g.8055  ORF Transcript_3255/g.8055 Transcript_3255/m.8055 type:complete len:444 (-) Transcript_3255:37-1368(-)